MTEELNIYQKDESIVPELFSLISGHKNEDAIVYIHQYPDHVNLKGWKDTTPLHIAVTSNNVEMVKKLIERGAKINALSQMAYFSPLAEAKDPEIAKLLLENGASINHYELSVATRYDRPDVVDLMLFYGAKLHDKWPEVLEAKSIAMLKVYQKHGIDLGICSIQGNLLHRFIWFDNYECFEYAFKNNVPWKVNRAGWETPFHFARRYKNHKAIEFLTRNYPELCSVEIRQLDNESYELDRIVKIILSPVERDIFIALTQKGDLIKFKIEDSKIKYIKIITIDFPPLRNFSLDEDNNIILPTKENKLYIIDIQTLDLINEIVLPEEIVFDQISYLKKHKIFIGSSQNWKLFILDESYQVVKTLPVKFGTISPCFNKSEALMVFHCYDQPGTFHNLFEISNPLDPNFVHVFSKNFYTHSCSADIYENTVAVTYDGSVIFYEYKDQILNRLKKIKTSKISPEAKRGHVNFISKDMVIVGKGNNVIYIDVFKGEIIKSIQLNTDGRIYEVYFIKELQILFLLTTKGVLIHEVTTEENYT